MRKKLWEGVNTHRIRRIITCLRVFPAGPLKECRSVLSLLRNIESISSCRDRGKLPSTLLGAVDALFGGSAHVGIFSRDPQGEGPLRLATGTTAAHVPGSFWGEWLKNLRRDGSLATSQCSGLHCGALVLDWSELSSEELILIFSTDQPLCNERSGSVETLARIFGNQIRLLDYSELDSLTRLLNRKTFDETFDRLLSSSSAKPNEEATRERRACDEEDCPAWLGVIDIDHFKRVNDSFGHLFGDEVLLRMGELMRKTFRGGDRLFRFGGEEFVAILNAPDENLAAAGFERFRCSVETHEFPQVGKVTCSIGFTAVSRQDVPTDVVGRGDEALYYAKKNGRNRVCSYERLLADGAIAKPEPVTAKIADDFDIDALFG